MTRYTDAQAKAIKKYLAGQAEIKIRMLPVQKDRIVAAAKNSGKNLQEYVYDAIEAQIARDEDCEPVPDGSIYRLVKWLKAYGVPEGDIVGCLEAFGHEPDSENESSGDY